MPKRVRFHSKMTPEMRRWLTAARRCGAQLKTAIDRYEKPHRVGGGNALEPEYRRRAESADQTLLYDCMQNVSEEAHALAAEIAKAIAAEGKKK